MKLKKVTMTVEVLMPEDDSFGAMSLAEIHDECMDGEWSMRQVSEKEDIVEGKDAVLEACQNHGTDVSFFFPDEEAVEA